MSNDSICPCEQFGRPRTLYNPPGLDSIQYRIGDFISFRRALLAPLHDDNGNSVETELSNWRPAPNGDLTLQLVEWWAYIADILTFYNERIANETYLRTATQPESLQRLIRLLGYRPRPGIGASGLVAALLSPGATSAQLPQGMGFQSKPPPGGQPQIFELDQAATIGLPDSVSADLSPPAVSTGISPPATPTSASQANSAGADSTSSSSPSGPAIDSLLLKGEVSGLKPGDSFLLMDKQWSAQNSNYGWFKISGTGTVKDPRGNANTLLQVAGSLNAWQGFDVQNCQLMSPSQTAHFWPYGDPVIDANSAKVHLDRQMKQINAGDLLLFEDLSQPQVPQPATLHSVSSYEETLWYANHPQGDSPITAPTGSIPPIAVLHSLIGLNPDPDPNWNSNAGNINIHFNWREVGQLIPEPVQSVDSSNLGGSGPATLQTAPSGSGAAPGAAFPPNLTNAGIFIQDANGAGIQADASTDSAGSTISLSGLPKQPFVLKPPLNVLFNLLPVSRGKTVTNEVLGSGDASAAGQEFVLNNSPLTYFMSADSSSGDNYKSTLRVWVNGIEWQEAPSFYGRGPQERIFVTREDENANTHVQFGDGVNGSRLPSGSNNVIANYRFGSGAQSPAAGSLTVIMQPQSGLKSVSNPVAVGGGEDPDPASRIRQYGPRSILNFGRAVSAEDYEVVATQAPGVGRAKSVWSFDGATRKVMPVIYVGDDDNAVIAARKAISLAGDPNRPFSVVAAVKIPMKLQLVLEKAANYATQVMLDAVTNLLTDQETGLFGSGNVSIGQVFYRSQIDAACQKSQGVVAVHQVQVSADSGSGFTPIGGSTYDPGQEGFFSLDPSDLSITAETVNS
jgi:hypothetical protein